MKPVKPEQTELLPQSRNDVQNASKNRKTIVFACAGVCDYGKLTMLAASTLSFRKPNMYRAAGADKGIDRIKYAIADGFRVLALEGCTEYCARKKLDEAGLKADVHLMALKLGIDKTTPLNMKNLETIINAIREN